MLLELLKAHPEFSVSFSLSGLAIEQMEYYKPELIEKLQGTGGVQERVEAPCRELRPLYLLAL